MEGLWGPCSGHVATLPWHQVLLGVAMLEQSLGQVGLQGLVEGGEASLRASWPC